MDTATETTSTAASPRPRARDLVGPGRPAWPDLPGHRHVDKQPRRFGPRRWRVLGAVLAILVLGVAALGLAFAQAVLATAEPGEEADASGVLPGVVEVDVAGAAVDLPQAAELAATPAQLPAWWAPADPERAVVLVHGRGATRSAMLPMARVAHDAGWSVLVVSHRGDGIAPEPADGVAGFGTREWPDLDAAVRWLAARGVDEVVLGGSSQGAMVAAVWWEQAGRRSHGALVTGAVFDSPLLSLTATLRQQAANRAIPAPLVRPVVTATKAWAWALGGLDAAAAEPLFRAEEWALPTLLLAGEHDDQVPASIAVEFASDAPATVLELFDAGHVEASTSHADRWEAAVSGFLDDRRAATGGG